MLKTLCVYVLKKLGWEFVNNVPDEVRSFVFIGAPHTSNYDFFPAMAVSKIMNRNARFVIKSEWMRFPYGPFMRSAGAIGLDRKSIKESHGLSTTDVMAQLFQEHHDLVLMISPEGTRGPVAHWKTGFYHIALKAKVPIVLGFADYEKKQAGSGMILYPSVFEDDMKTIMKFYQGVKGKRPEKFLLDQDYLP